MSSEWPSSARKGVRHAGCFRWPGLKFERAAMMSSEGMTDACQAGAVHFAICNLAICNLAICNQHFLMRSGRASSELRMHPEEHPLHTFIP